jgi:hypothetical protein
VQKTVQKKLDDDPKSRQNEVPTEMLERPEIESDFLNPV